MKLPIKLIILLLLISNITYAQEWVKTNIKEFASIDFPIESELIETGNETVYNAKDEVAFYLVSVRKLTDQQSSQITKADFPTIYQGVVNGTLESANAELISINEINIQTIPAVELEYKAQTHSELPSQRFKRIIYLNQNIISIDFWPLTDQAEIINERKAKYFNSFIINTNEVAQTPTTENQNSAVYNASYQTGLIVGQIVFFVILISFIVGFVFLIRYLIKRNKKKKVITHFEEPARATVTKIVCQNCHTENRADTKYCSSCGFELKKI